MNPQQRCLQRVEVNGNQKKQPIDCNIQALMMRALTNIIDKKSRFFPEKKEVPDLYLCNDVCIKKQKIRSLAQILSLVHLLGKTDQGINAIKAKTTKQLYCCLI